MPTSKPTNRFDFENVPVSFLVNTMFGKRRNALKELTTDLLVIDLHERMRLGGGPKEIDTMLDGAIGRAIAEQEFSGTLGDSIIIPQPSASIGNILVVGVGKAAQYQRSTLCGFIRFVLETAVLVGAKKITLPIFPGRLDEVSVSGTLAVIRCRVSQFAAAPTGIGNLKEIEFLCAPQARRQIVEGLSITKQLCQSCSNPKIA
jgi:hypothetical protein